MTMEAYTVVWAPNLEQPPCGHRLGKKSECGNRMYEGPDSSSACWLECCDVPSLWGPQ